MEGYVSWAAMSPGKAEKHMGLRFALARAVGRVSTPLLKHVFRRPAANFPGKIALYVDPRLIADLAPRLSEGSIVVCGTNGKTTVTNLMADTIEQAGKSVICNRTGANLDSGVATSLLQESRAHWGVFECDEMWLSKVLPGLQSRYLLLLNLFRDQLDRVGEVSHVQESIIRALDASPDTVLVYNADDPWCAHIAQRVANESIAFGVREDMKIGSAETFDTQLCQTCSAELQYSFRQYDQLGHFICTECGFERAGLDFAAEAVRVTRDNMNFEVLHEETRSTVSAPFSGAYMVYNLLSSYVGSFLAGCSADHFQKALDGFNPQNGRLQQFDISGRDVLLNLAKNPTGFNQNMSLISQDDSHKIVAFFVNNKEGDGRDVSWLKDVSFESLRSEESELHAFAGGSCALDVRNRLAEAGLEAVCVESISEVFAHVDGVSPDRRMYVVANYTALFPVQAELSRL